MLVPTYLNLNYFLYAIGNTPAVNLLREIIPKSYEVVRILSLACGDPRNILFSLWSEAAYGKNTVPPYEPRMAKADDV